MSGHVSRRASGLIRLFAALVALLPSAAPAQAQPAPAPTLYDQALRALGEGMPRVAVYKLKTFLQTSPAPAAHRDAVLALARALLAVPDAPAALALLDREFPSPANGLPDTAVMFWRGQAQAALGHWSDALESYTAAGTQAPARFGQAESFFALDRATDAAAIFRSLRDDPQLGESARLRFAEIALDTGHLKETASVLTDAGPGPIGDGGAGRALVLKKERAYLLGRLRLAQRQPAQAAQAFTGALAGPEGLSERLLVDCYWGWTQACLDQNNLETAQDALENLIDRYPGSPSLAGSFAWLESFYARDRAPDLSVPRRWSEDAAEPGRQALARLTVARLEERVGHHELAEKILATFGETFPQSPLRMRALLDLAALRLRQGRPNAARLALDVARPLVTALPTVAAGLDGDHKDMYGTPPTAATWRTEIDVLDAEVCLALNDGPGAARRFEAVADRLGTGPQAEAAAFNAVLGWLRATDVDRFTSAEKEFSARFPNSRLNGEFPLEEGLARAALTPSADTTGRRRAAACLRQFLSENPESPRAAEARLALAELAFERPRPAIPVAWRELAAPDLRPVANDTASTPPPVSATTAERDRAAYLAIWLADAPGASHDADHAITLARTFLADHPESGLAAEARMKLGEMYFQREDYPNAQTQLELLAENAPDSVLAEPALYLAGMSAELSASGAGLDKAVALFSRAARRNGPFHLRAQLQLADVQNRLGKGRDALTLYDGVLAGTATNAALALKDEDLEARCAALCGRGQTLVLLAATSNDPKQFLHDAVGAFDQLAALPGASLPWRRQALTLKGETLEKLNDADAALAAYDDALEAPGPSLAVPASSATPPPEWTWFYRAGPRRRTVVGEAFAMGSGHRGLRKDRRRQRPDEERVRESPEPPPAGAFRVGWGRYALICFLRTRLQT